MRKRQKTALARRTAVPARSKARPRVSEVVIDAEVVQKPAEVYTAKVYVPPSNPAGSVIQCCGKPIFNPKDL